jgi:hypothetical protein
MQIHVHLNIYMIFVIPAYVNPKVDSFPNAQSFLRRLCIIAYTHGILYCFIAFIMVKIYD